MKTFTDKQLLDWLESKSDGSSCIARPSETGRGYRLHNTGSDDSGLYGTSGTFRGAIAAAMRNEVYRDSDGHCSRCGEKWPDPKEFEGHTCPPGFKF